MGDNDIPNASPAEHGGDTIMQNNSTPEDQSSPRAKIVARVLDIIGGSSQNSFWDTLAIAAFAIGTLTIISFSLPFDDGYWRRAGMMYAIALGAWMAGGTLGFLFGVPRYKSAPDAQGSAAIAGTAQEAMAFIPNTNLEQISDWLTKIIVGATLVQLGPIGDAFLKLCSWIATTTHPDAAGFCGGIIIFFAFAGFLWGYLWCSIRIFTEMVRVTKQLQNPS